MNKITHGFAVDDNMLFNSLITYYLMLTKKFEKL